MMPGGLVARMIFVISLLFGSVLKVSCTALRTKQADASNVMRSNHRKVAQ